jgi:hypothetical protein
MNMKFKMALTSATLLAVIPCRSTGQAMASQALPGPGAKAGQTLENGYVVKAVTQQWTVMEKTGETSGEFLFVEAGGKVTRIKKTLGAAGPKSDPPPVVPLSPEVWKQLATAKNDFLAEQYLAEKNAKNEDPSFADIQKRFPRILNPETTVGMNSYPHNVAVNGNGSVEVNIGFVTGVELTFQNYCQQLQFHLNGRSPNPQECEATISRRLLGGWLPATDYRYRMTDQPAGWEQSVVMGYDQGRPGLCIRFRIANLDDKPQTISFAVAPPAGGRFEQSPAGLTVFAPAPQTTQKSFDNDPARTKAYAAMLAAMPVAVPFSVSIPCEFKDGKPSWNFSLPAKGTRDLCLFYPGFQDGKLTRLPDGETETAFYTTLKEQYDSWTAYLAKGTDITLPEPGLEDIFRATLCRILCTAHGDKFEGGMLHYRGFWQFTHLHSVRLMLDAGQFEKARAALVYFMDKRILPDGRFQFDWSQEQYQIFDIGEFLQAMAKYYETTGDASLILKRQETIGQVLKFLRDNRAQSLAKFPEGDPRRGMLSGSFENDVPEQNHYYTNDIHVWYGLRDYATVLNRIAATLTGKPLVAAAKEMRNFTSEFHRNLRASFDKAGIIRDAKGKTIAFQCMPDLANEGLQSKFYTNENWNMYRRFQQQPRMFAHSFATDAETAAFLDFQAQNDQTILGVRRWRSEVIDDFVAFEIDYQRLRLDRVREFQMKYFAYLQTLTAVGTWTGYEEVQAGPFPGTNALAPYAACFPAMTGFEGLHATIVTPMLTKQMFCFDEPTADAIWLAAGISTHWLKDGQPLTAKRMGSRYGWVDLILTWKAAQKTLTTTIVPQPGRTMAEVRLRLRAPGDKTLKSAALADGTPCKIQGNLAILRNLSQPTVVVAQFIEK